MERTLAARRRGTAVPFVLIMALIAGFSFVSAPAAGAATPAQEEPQFLTLLNQERVDRGLKPLVADTRYAATAREWSGEMSARNTLSHDGGLAADATSVDSRWRSIGENVGYGYSVQQLHDAFMASSGHRANILKPSYNRVGIGVVHNGTKIWVTVRFMEGPAIAGSTGLGPPPPPPGVRTVLTGDFDGDGHGDVLTYQPGSGTDELWFGRSGNTFAKSSVSVSGQYRPVAGDFDGDGRTEILWYVPGSTADPLWNWNGSGWTSTNLTVSGTFVPKAGDFDGDGRDDILWYAAGTAGDAIWYGNANGSFSSSTMAVTAKYQPFVGNFDGARGDDIFWYAPGTGADSVWYSGSSRGAFTSVKKTVNGSYQPFSGDFDGNRVDDIFWYGPGKAADYAWYDTTSGAVTSVTWNVTNTYLPAAADFGGDHLTDVVWFSPSTLGGDSVWLGQSNKTYGFTSVK